MARTTLFNSRLTSVSKSRMESTHHTCGICSSAQNDTNVCSLVPVPIFIQHCNHHLLDLICLVLHLLRMAIYTILSIVCLFLHPTETALSSAHNELSSQYIIQVSSMCIVFTHGKSYSLHACCIDTNRLSQHLTLVSQHHYPNPS